MHKAARQDFLTGGRFFHIAFVNCPLPDCHRSSAGNSGTVHR